MPNQGDETAAALAAAGLALPTEDVTFHQGTRRDLMAAAVKVRARLRPEMEPAHRYQLPLLQPEGAPAPAPVSPAGDLTDLGIAQAAGLLAAGELTATALLQAHLDRIDRLDPRLSAVAALRTDAARAAAEAADRAFAAGRSLGPLHGIPVGIKDIFDVSGERTGAASRWTEGHVAPCDSTVTARLQAAGAILLAKLNCWELSVGGPSFDLPQPPARNPWNLEREPGGSSSGSGAAVAAGLVMGAVGGDTGGSVRLPAAYCGVVGLKPTLHRVDATGAIPFAWSLDCPGPLARSVADCALLYEALAGLPPMPFEPATGLRAGVPRAFLDLNPPAAAMAAAFEVALRVLADCGVPSRDVAVADAADYNACYFLIARSEAYARFEADLTSDPMRFGTVARRSLAAGAFLSASDYVNATRRRGALAAAIADLFNEVDVLVLPTTPDEAGPLDPAAAVTRADSAPYTRPFSLCGFPAISLPCGFGASGLPLGLQFVAPPGREDRLFTVAAAYEAAAGWSGRRPGGLS